LILPDFWRDFLRTMLHRQIFSSGLKYFGVSDFITAPNRLPCQPSSDIIAFEKMSYRPSMKRAGGFGPDVKSRLAFHYIVCIERYDFSAIYPPAR
jgi:hypothetical protein